MARNAFTPRSHAAATACMLIGVVAFVASRNSLNGPNVVSSPPSLPKCMPQSIVSPGAAHSHLSTKKESRRRILKSLVRASSEPSLSSSSPSSSSSSSVASNKAETSRRRPLLLGIPASTAGSILSMADPMGRTAIAKSSEEAALPPYQIPKMGIGAWAWGDTLYWGYDAKKDDELKEAYDYCMSHGVKFFDTAEVYGLGRSETLLGKFSKNGQTAEVATKFAALPWRRRKDVVAACKKSLQRLGRENIELYQIHFPGAFNNKEFWDGLADCYEQGLVRSVGVSNYGVEALSAVSKELKQRGVPLASNQIQYSLLYRYPEENDLKQACDDLGVKILAYSPLNQGFLTGKYTMENLPKGPRASIARKLLQDSGYTELMTSMQSVADQTSSTKAQVALAWCIAKGTCPIPGARNLRQAKENCAALNVGLNKEQVSLLDTAAARVSPPITPESLPFPKYDKDLGIRMFDS